MCADGSIRLVASQDSGLTVSPNIRTGSRSDWPYGQPIIDAVSGHNYQLHVHSI